MENLFSISILIKDRELLFGDMSLSEFSIVDIYSLLVTIVATLFAIFSLALTCVGYIKFKHVDKIVQDKLKEEMNNFRGVLQDELVNIQDANSKIQASYNYFETDISNAIKLLAEAEKACPYAYNLYNTFGYAYKKIKDYYQAERMFKKAIKLHPTRGEGYNDLSNMYREIKEDKKASLCYKLALKKVENAEQKWQGVK